jgi:hypothetical protein
MYIGERRQTIVSPLSRVPSEGENGAFRRRREGDRTGNGMDSTRDVRRRGALVAFSRGNVARRTGNVLFEN